MLQEKPPALKREHPSLQKMKLSSFFLYLWVIFALLDPDPDPDYESGSRYGSMGPLNPDPIRIRIHNTGF
jgi:hypothetical protein